MIANDLLASDHMVICTKIRGSSSKSAFVRPSWNFTKANWPLFSEMCDYTLAAFSANLQYSHQLFETSILDAASLSVPKTKPWRNHLSRGGQKTAS